MSHFKKNRFYFILLFFLRFYLFIHRDRERKREAEGEAGSMQEPDAGLNPRSPGSHPRPQAAPNRYTTGAARKKRFYMKILVFQSAEIKK